MNDYFLICGKESRQIASAFAPKGLKFDNELIEDLTELAELPFELNLIKLSVQKEGLAKSNDLTSLKEIWLDYIPNSLAWPFFSVKLKNTITRYLTGNEGINWISAKVNGNNEQKTYYIPRFGKKLDVLDTSKTIFVEGTDHIMIPCFSSAKIINYAMFTTPSSDNLWKITHALYVNEIVKKAIQKEKLTGIGFEKTRVF